MTAALKYKVALLKHMRPAASTTLETMRSSSRPRPQGMISDPELAHSRISWCFRVISQVRERIGFDTAFRQNYTVALDESWALLTILEEQADPLEALLGFAQGSCQLLFDAAESAIPLEALVQFGELVNDDPVKLIEFVSRYHCDASGTLLAQIVVFQLASAACVTDVDCQDFEHELNKRFRAVLFSGEQAQA